MRTFEESWGTVQPHQAPPCLSKHTEEVLMHLGEKHTAKLTGWLKDLVDKVPQQERVDTWLPRRYALIEESAQIWIDSIIERLQGFAVTFNASDVGEHLHIAIESAKATVTLPCRRDPSTEPYNFRCYQGHLVTYSWALLVRSYYESIQIFLIPSDSLFALAANSLPAASMKPLVELRAAVNDKEVMWALDDTNIDMQALPALCRELFSDFIRVALQMIDIGELFLPAHSSECRQENKVAVERSEDLRRIVKELQLWQTRVIFSKAMVKDLDKLREVAAGGELASTDREQLDTLLETIGGLQKSWSELLERLSVQSS